MATAAANVGDTAKRPADERPDQPYPDIDVRGEKRTAPTARQLRAARELDGAGVRWGRFGTPRLVSPQGKGALTAASDADPGTVALNHVRDHADLYGLSAAELSALEVVKSYRTKHNGLRHVFIGQADPSGVPVNGGRLSVAVDKHGRIVTVAGSLVPEVPGAHTSDAARLDRKAAIDRAAASVGTVDPSGTVTAARVTFPLAGDGARPAWRTTLTAGNGHVYDTVVDAGNGEILLRNDLTHNEGPQGRVFTGQNPNAGGAAVVPFAGLGRSWVDGRVTTGNNAEVSQNLDGGEALGYQPQTPAAGDPAYQHFNYTFTDAFRTSGGTDLTTDRDPVVTQAFYL
ncbi:hypothetical protein [Streptomyces sp. ISL-100]|uniref:hypothetical protein n=1 Tax=Streptomyces sp. ISL-100 TaxID=2819173 RepID=UPI001BE6C065|nr:hypothetical protein [Streptomyces sp. ISL-100]MBT2401904.1 hypothetical protein [Streptomyces sp. ISL-100]